MKTNTKTKNIRKSLGMAILIAMAVMDVVMLALFLFGSAHSFGTRTGVINVLYFFINIIGTARAVAYRNVSNFILGLFWVLFLVLMLKHIITNLRDIVKISRVKNINREQFDYFRDVTSPMYLTIAFIFLCNLVEESSIDWFVLVALGVNIVVKYLAGCYRLFCYPELGKGAVGGTIGKDYHVAAAIRLALLYAIAVFLTKYAFLPLVKDFVTAIYALISISKSMSAIAIVRLVYNGLIDWGMQLAVAVTVLSVIAKLERNYPGKEKNLFATAEIRLCVCSAIMLIINSIFPFLGKDGLNLPEQNEAIDTVLSVTKDWYLPVFALSLVFMLSSKISIKPALAKGKKNKSETERQAEAETEEGAADNAQSAQEANAQATAQQNAAQEASQPQGGNVNVPNCGYEFEVWKLTVSNLNAMCGTCGQPLQVFHTKQESFAVACSSMAQGKSCGEKPITVNSLAKQFASWRTMLYGEQSETVNLDEMKELLNGLSLHESRVQFFLKRK